MEKISVVDTLVISALGKWRELNRESKVICRYTASSGGQNQPTDSVAILLESLLPHLPLASSCQDNAPGSPPAEILYYFKWQLRCQRNENSIVLETRLQRVAIHSAPLMISSNDLSQTSGLHLSFI